MPFSVVLDANVLYPASLRDTLLRLASAGFFVPVCSELILDEVERNVVSDGRVVPADAPRLRRAMECVFEDAWVPTAAVREVEPAMTNDVKDRHVLAAAVVSEAQTIVSSDVSGFPEEATARYGIQVQGPDEFLVGLFGLGPSQVLVVLEAQAAALRKPPMSVDEILDALEIAGAPEFVAAVRRARGRMAGVASGSA